MQRAEDDQSQGPVQRSSFRRSRELAKERAAAEAAKVSELAAEDAQLRRGKGLSSLYNTKVRAQTKARLQHPDGTVQHRCVCLRSLLPGKGCRPLLQTFRTAALAAHNLELASHPSHERHALRPSAQA